MTAPIDGVYQEKLFIGDPGTTQTHAAKAMTTVNVVSHGQMSGNP